MRLNKLRLLLMPVALLTMLSACSHAPLGGIAGPAKELPHPKASVLPDPDPIHTEPVTFGEATVGGKKVYTLDEQNFSVFGSNMGDIARWVEEAKFRLKCYANGGVCEDAEKPAEKAR